MESTERRKIIVDLIQLRDIIKRGNCPNCEGDMVYKEGKLYCRKCNNVYVKCLSPNVVKYPDYDRENPLQGISSR